MYVLFLQPHPDLMVLITQTTISLFLEHFLYMKKKKKRKSDLPEHSMQLNNNRLRLVPLAA